jgi:alpha-glucoside transport system permease protein
MTTTAPGGARNGAASAKVQSLLRLLLSFGIAVVTILALRWGVGFMRDTEASRIALLFVGLLTGVVGVWAIYWVLNDLVMRLPIGHARSLALAYVFVGPALLLLAVFLLYPAINTIRLSFFDAAGETFVGLDNYIAVLTSPEFLIVLRNNALWLVFGTLFSVTLGLVIATLVDRVRGRRSGRGFSCRSPFRPSAPALRGDSCMPHATQPPQIGLLNGRHCARRRPGSVADQEPLDNLALIAILIWAQTGFCMVILSAALKAYPQRSWKLRIDGTNELLIFFRVLIPSIRAAIFTVATTIVVAVLKVFDIVCDDRRQLSYAGHRQCDVPAIQKHPVRHIHRTGRDPACRRAARHGH